ERRDAHASQPRREHPAGRRRRSLPARRGRYDRVPSVLPYLRYYGYRAPRSVVWSHARRHAEVRTRSPSRSRGKTPPNAAARRSSRSRRTAKHPSVEGRDFSSIRKLFSGAAPLGAEVTLQCMRRIGCVLQQGYGLTETSPAALITSEHPAEIKPGSIGWPVANTECRIVDPESGRDVASGVDGEIWIRGPQVMR